MASQGRFERPTFPLGGGCSIQLSYWDSETAGERLRQEGEHVTQRFAVCHAAIGQFARNLFLGISAGMTEGR